MLRVLGLLAILVWCQFILILPSRAQVGSTCPPVAGLAPHPDTLDAMGLQMYLARAVAMNNLTDELLPAPFAWNTTVQGTPCYTGGPPAEATSYRDSLSCRGLCNYPFCPANFTADVALLVRLKATFVQYATGSWSGPEKFIPNSPFLVAAAETVRRINAAFDCAGLPRPYIQAGVYENLDPGFTCGTPTVPCQQWMRPGLPGINSGVNNIIIPPELLLEFRNEIMADTTNMHYFDATGQPRTNVHFDFFRITHSFIGGWYTPNINLLEGQLWFFYQASCLLDAGYSALHLGQPKIWAQLYAVGGAERKARLHRIALLVSHIRNYARTHCPISVSLLLMAEPMDDTTLSGLEIVKFEDGPGKLIFDVNLATMRPRETSPALDIRAQTQRGTAYKCPVIRPQSFLPRACSGQYMALIDPCHGYNFVPDGGGHTPLGFTYASQTPYIVYFDHNDTVKRLPNGELAPPGKLWPDNQATWGWDDSAWFTAALSDSCQAAWLRYELAQIRMFTPQSSFLAAPGRLINDIQVGLLHAERQTPQPERGVPDYRLAAHPLVAQAVAEAWEPVVPQPFVALLLGAGVMQKLCAGSNFWHRNSDYLPAYQLRVPTPDATSIYSWSIHGPEGQATRLYGSQVLFFPTQAGNYALELRQQNLGLPAGTSGLRTIVLPALTAEAQCLTAREARHLRRAVKDSIPEL